MAPLSRFRIVELGVGPVTGLATMVLADFGADVIKVVPKDGDPYATMGSWPLWTRGKRIVNVDLEDADQLTALRSLIIDSADAVVTSLDRTAREAIGLDPESLGRPDLVLGIVSGFGEEGPYANYPAYEPVVAAKSGRMLNFAGVADRPGPNYSALQVGTHATAQAAAAGLLAGLLGREASGHGYTFDTSLLRGMMPYEMGIMAMAQLWDKGILERPKVTRDRTVSMPTLNYHPVRTKPTASGCSSATCCRTCSTTSSAPPGSTPSSRIRSTRAIRSAGRARPSRRSAISSSNTCSPRRWRNGRTSSSPTEASSRIRTRPPRRRLRIRTSPPMGMSWNGTGSPSSACWRI